MIKDILHRVKTKSIPKLDALKAIEKIKLQNETSLSNYTKLFKFDEPYLRDHTVFGERLLLGVTHCSLAINAFVAEFPQTLLSGLKRISFVNPICLSEGEQAQVQIKIQLHDRCRFISQYRINNNEQYAITAKGEYLIDEIPNLNNSIIDINAIKSRAKHHYKSTEIYNKIRDVSYGESLRTLDDLYLGEGESLGKLSLKSDLNTQDCNYLYHPALLDGALLSAVSYFLLTDKQDTYIPFFIESLIVIKSTPSSLWCYGKIVKTTDEIIQCNLSLYDDSGSIYVDIQGFTCKRVKDAETLIASIKSGKNIQYEDHLVNKKTPLKTQVIANSLLLQDGIKDYLQRKLEHSMEQPLTQLDIKKNFMELGLSSISLVQIATEIESEIGIELYPTIFFEYQNLFDLVAYFIKEYQSEFTTYLLDNKLISETNTQNNDPQIVQEVEQTRLIDTNQSKSSIRTKRTSTQYTDIAVIGMSGVFAKSPDLGSFWEHLKQGSNLMHEIPPSRFELQHWYDESGNDPQKIYCKWGSFIDEVDKFDADFFNISQREAEIMDPQLRQLLQVTYLTTENAGYVNRIRGSNTGVFVGCCFYDYQTDMLINGKPIEVYDGICNSPTMLSNRQSFFYDLKGPSLTVDTACSSSLVALHLACQAMRNDECDMAFVSGANLLLTPGHYHYFCRIGALGHSGRCHTFDSRADGYIPGEGIGAVLLKPLHKALEDNDQIHGVIKGSAIKHGGHASSITAPNVKGEEDVILRAWQDANIAPESISYIEAHGTGTALGDPIEFQATERALRRYTKKQEVCAIGSAKAHIGHLEGAAGIVGLIKVLLSMKHQTLPAMPAFENINPYIKSKDSPLFINTKSIPWQAKETPRRAGINSFGFGGTFVHTVIEEYRHSEPATTKPENTVNSSPILIILSANNPQQLFTKANKLRSDIINYEESYLADIAYTLQLGREAMPSRLALIVNNKNELLKKLQEILDDKIQDKLTWFGNTNDNQDIVDIFSSDQNLLKYLDQYIQDTPSLSHIAQLWVKGININWELLYKNKRCNIIDLSGHIFEKRSYWYKPLQSEMEQLIATSLSEIPQYDGSIQTLQQSQQELDALSFEGLILQLKAMNFFSLISSSNQTEASLMEELGVLPKYKRFFHIIVFQMISRSLLVKESDNILKLNEERLPWLQNLSQISFDQKIKILEKKYPDLKAFSSLLYHCLTYLNSVIIGQSFATDILFEQGSLERVERVYTGNSISDYFNHAIANFIHCFLQKAPNSKIKILEIGAGTGGTSRLILDTIKQFSSKIEYIYTDISAQFLEFAENKYSKKYPFLKTAILDIEKPHTFPIGKSEVDKADIIIASNVIHATQNISQSLSNISDYLIKNNGLFILNELTETQLLMTLTFGLLDGWWRYQDEEIRLPGGPLISDTNWSKLLRDAGYCNINCIPNFDVGQRVIISRYKPVEHKKKPVFEPASVSISVANNLKTIESDHETLSKLTQIIALMLNMDEHTIDIDSYFLDLGMDSLKGIEFKEKINHQFNINLETTALINYPTASQLATYIDDSFIRSKKTQEKKVTPDRFGRYVVKNDIAEKLKKEKKLTSKTDVNKLFSLPETKQSSTKNHHDQIYKIFESENVVIDSIATDSVQLEYIRSGINGPPIILLSPLNTLAVVWHNQINLLSKTNQVFCFHYPGFGQSQFKENIFDMDRIGDEIISAMEILKVKPAYHLIGWSMGGLIGQSIAERHPKKVKNLSLIGTGTISMFDDDYYNEHTHIKHILEAEINATDTTHKALKENHDLLIGTYNTEILIHYAQKIRDFDHKRRRNITAPVMVINGGDDKVLLPKYAKALIDNFPNATYREIKQAGHFLALTHPKNLNWHLKRFITSVK